MRPQRETTRQGLHSGSYGSPLQPCGLCRLSKRRREHVFHTLVLLTCKGRIVNNKETHMTMTQKKPKARRPSKTTMRILIVARKGERMLTKAIDEFERRRYSDKGYQMVAAHIGSA